MKRRSAEVEVPNHFIHHATLLHPPRHAPPPIFLLWAKLNIAQKFTPLTFFLSQAINFAYTKTTSKEFSQFVLKRCADQSTLPFQIRLKTTVALYKLLITLHQ